MHSREELANTLTHGAGVLASVAGLTLMLALTAGADGGRLAGALVFGVTLVLLYAASTLYHAFSWTRLRHALQVLDHACIYLLIAGTYTPFALVTLRGPTGWWLFGVVWGLAIAGAALEAAWVHRPRWLSALVYIAMGWLVILVREPLFARLPAGGQALLLAGGVVYTLGTLFYVVDRVPFMHAVFHLFVLGGSVCHFLAVVLYVI